MSYAFKCDVCGKLVEGGDSRKMRRFIKATNGEEFRVEFCIDSDTRTSADVCHICAMDLLNKALLLC